MKSEDQKEYNSNRILKKRMNRINKTSEERMVTSPSTNNVNMSVNFEDNIHTIGKELEEWYMLEIRYIS